MLIDLQIHSNYSDGYLTPTEVVRFLAKQGVKTAALTDHNTVGGTHEFAAACLRHNIKPIVGLELYVTLGVKKLNVLWYNFNPASPELHAMLRDSQTRRRTKARAILELMVKDGFVININKVLDKYNHYVSINHVIDDICAHPVNRKKIQKELGHSRPREEEIIKRYFFSKIHPRFNNSYIDIKRVIALRKKIGGQLVFNHPGKYNQLKRDILVELKKIGIDGIEVLSPHHSIGAVLFAQDLAMQYGFIMSGGSDFHKFESLPNALITNSWQYYKVEHKMLRGVEKIIG
ncbi:MAG: PHP domain-containing protein [Candidatus Falkowbacteria bacterium]